MLVSERARSPRPSASAHAPTSSRAVFAPTAMSVIFDWTIWNSAIVRPNAVRSRA